MNNNNNHNNDNLESDIGSTAMKTEATERRESCVDRSRKSVSLRQRQDKKQIHFLLIYL